MSIIRKIYHKIKFKIKYNSSSLIVKLSKNRKISDKILIDAKNMHQGKRCFIIGNGPSLTRQDLDALEEEVTFASNRIYRMFTQTDWRPTYFVMFDESVAESAGVIDGVNSFECKMKFVREQGYYIYKKLKGKICYVHTMYSRKYLDNPSFSEDAMKGIYTIASVTYSMIELAVHMGFKEIYLLGMDNRYAYSYTRDGKVVRNEGVLSYFSDNQEEKPDPLSAAATWELDIAFEYAEQYSKEHGFRIFNATRGGFLEKFERVDLDNILM